MLQNVRDDPDDHDSPDRQHFHLGDQDDRELLQAIKWKLFSGDQDDQSQNTAVSHRFRSVVSNEKFSDFDTCFFMEEVKELFLKITHIPKRFLLGNFLLLFLNIMPEGQGLLFWPFTNMAVRLGRSVAI